MKDTIKLFFFGDSIMLGQGVSLHQSWVSRISEAVGLIAEDKNRNIITVNSSINGDTTRSALERMPFDVQSHGVDIIVIQFGLNDCNCWVSNYGLPRVSPNAFKANLYEIIQRAHEFGAKRVFLNTNHPLPAIADQKRNYEYNNIIRRVAYDSPGVTLIDIENLFFKEIQNSMAVGYFLLEDHVHLNLKGHELYYNSLLNRISYAVLEAL